MKTSEYRLENYQAVFDDYRGHEINQRLAKTVHALSALAIHPHVEYARGVQDDLTEHFANDGRVLWVVDHTSGLDPFGLAAAAKREKTLNPLIGNVIVPGHVGMQNGWYSPPIRPILDNFKMLTTWRNQDVDKELKAAKLHARSEEHPAITEKFAALRKDASREWVRTCVSDADKGINIVIFPAGSRKRQEIRSGTANIASQIKDRERFRILGGAVNYSHSPTHLRPNIFIGPLEKIPDTPVEITHLVQIIRDHCREQAAAMG